MDYLLDPQNFTQPSARLKKLSECTQKEIIAISISGERSNCSNTAFVEVELLQYQTDLHTFRLSVTLPEGSWSSIRNAAADSSIMASHSTFPLASRTRSRPSPVVVAVRRPSGLQAQIGRKRYLRGPRAAHLETAGRPSGARSVQPGKKFSLDDFARNLTTE